VPGNSPIVIEERPAMTANTLPMPGAQFSADESGVSPEKRQSGAMRLLEVARVLDAVVITGHESLGITVESACCSDLMSDVLAFVHEGAVILTGIANAHVIRTAQMLDLKCIVFVRGKTPPEDVVALAKELGIVLMSVNKTMFTSAGLLYGAGMRGTPMKWASREGAGQVL